ncbi:MAG: transcription-repair coupling factor [Chlamydiales bacterium]|nr:transcription-repair coupling factor [Chlamydiales bacterium]
MKGINFLKSKKLQEFAAILKEGNDIVIEGLWDTPKALLATIARESTQKNILILTTGTTESHLIQDFAYLIEEGGLLEIPSWETLPTEEIAPSPDVVGERTLALKNLLHQKNASIVVCPLQSALQKVLEKKALSHLLIHLKVGSEQSFKGFPTKLLEMGYEQFPVANDKGQFAIRGGILDIFPVSSPDPFRIEFFEDVIESIRIYDPIGQKSIQKISHVEITPANEKLLLQKNKTVSLLDYLGKGTLILMDDLHALEDKAIQIAPSTTSHTFASFKNFLTESKSLQKIFITKSTLEELTEVSLLEKQAKAYSDNASATKIAFSMFGEDYTALRWRHPFVTFTDLLFTEDEDISQEALFFKLNEFKSKDIELTVLSDTENDEATFRKKIDADKILLPSKTHFQRGYLSSGFYIKDANLAIFPLTELFHRYKIRRQKNRSTFHTPPSELLELEPGDLVVHFHNGIGKYLGIEKKPNHNGIETEFLVIEYAEKTKLYVPIHNAYLINKYIGTSDALPTLHSINNTKWKALKAKTEGLILGYAQKLLVLYAERSQNKGFAFKEDSLDMHLFEQDFPYIETEDQKTAIAKLKQEMTSTKCMDLLICGDVGYGKTEVAMRGAFKAVIDGSKQVAVLVPTTLLAMQHFESFTERFRNFPVRIGVLSRFRTQKQIKETLKELQKGTLDIVIGTHRLISKDVHFKDLGLIIIDEEQRFGVKAKEHLKTIKTGVDCLTLSATPIPRTLYMSLVGARDMAVISTPPQDRLPIKTILAKNEDSIIQTALMRELARDGQAYIIHNRVESIFDVKARISKLLPEARILVAHGQMSADEIDITFHTFKMGNADILIATTIIESGIDIPNANTILIDRADKFGLSDLYQLRGRVGRWNRRAYCYFLTQQKHALSEIANKRLIALSQISGYGGGMRLAMRDLEIRGSGDLIGTEQSGHVSSIGFHLYCKLLRRTMNSLQGKGNTQVDVKLEFPQDARFTDEYISETHLRMELYQRLGELSSLEEVDELFNEIQDRFGKLPIQAVWLYHFSRIRMIASKNNIASLKLQSMTLTIEKQIKNKTETRTVIFSAPKTAEAFEKKIIEIIS